MSETISEEFRTKFMQELEHFQKARQLQEASVKGDLLKWTKLLTDVVVNTCNNLGWETAAKGHKYYGLPEARNEYLTIDVTAFKEREKVWRFPHAVFELENQQDPARIQYSLWKVLCVNADIKIVFCYRKDPSEVSKLIENLNDDVLGEVDIQKIDGEIIVVVGVRGEAETFPYGFFEWRRYDSIIKKLIVL